MKKFLSKVRVDVVRVISCGLCLKTKASRGIRKRKNVGHKLKLFLACGPSLRPRPLAAILRVRPFSAVEGFTGSELCHEEASPEMAPEVILGDAVDPETVVSDSRMGHLSPVRGLLRCSGDGVISGLDAAVSASPTVSLLSVILLRRSVYSGVGFCSVEILCRVLGLIWPEVLVVKRGCLLLGQTRPLCIWIWFWVWI